MQKCNYSKNEHCVTPGLCSNKHCCRKTYWLLDYWLAIRLPMGRHHHHHLHQSINQSINQSTKQAINRPCGYASCPAWVPRMITCKPEPPKKKTTPLEPATCFSLTSAFIQRNVFSQPSTWLYFLMKRSPPLPNYIKTHLPPPPRKKTRTPPKPNIGPWK